MAKVNLRLQGGPCDRQTVTLDVPDTSDPPELYFADIHGPHECLTSYEYRRIGRGPGGLS